jgi:hypothetical protein
MELRKMKKNLILMLIFLVFISCDQKLREAEKIYDKLELDVPSQELVSRLDILEQDLQGLSEKYYMGFNSSGIWFNRYEDNIKSGNMSTEFLRKSPITQDIFTLEGIENIVELYKVVVQNEISIHDFTSDYSCNRETIIWYKKGQCGPNNYCERRLYVRKEDSIDYGCFNDPNDPNDLLGDIDDMIPIDSIGEIYLLKPKRYIR